MSEYGSEAVPGEGDGPPDHMDDPFSGPPAKANWAPPVKNPWKSQPARIRSKKAVAAATSRPNLADHQGGSGVGEGPLVGSWVGAARPWAGVALSADRP